MNTQTPDRAADALESVSRKIAARSGHNSRAGATTQRRVLRGPGPALLEQGRTS